MDPHPDFAEIDLPRCVDLGPFHLTPLSPDQVDVDLAVVLDTAPLLQGLFGDWPAGLTREANLIDLAWHEREFTARRSFSWIIRREGGHYLGCFYLFPDLGTCGRARAVFWLRALPDRPGTARDLRHRLTGWLAVNLPPTLKLTWRTRPETGAPYVT
ncbi:MAG: hypothetical protein OIF48_13815 [Silicimonas sp.]|nr:hypothetical protein [Silicimonas sp.]